MLWLYKEKEINSEDLNGYVAFVYQITNMISGKRYIGKKKLTTYRRVKIKNKTNRKKIIKESDWKTYFGSNKELKSDVKEFGEDNFKREIIRLCKSNGEASYYEAKFLFNNDVLLSRDLWYNDWIMVKVHRTHLKG